MGGERVMAHYCYLNADLDNDNPKSLYLCGPIDGVIPEWATEWRRQVTEALPGWEVLDPTDGKNLGIVGINDTVYTPEEIVEADLAMIKRADVVLVDWRPMDRTYGVLPLRVGTIMEVCYAYQWGKRIISFGNLRRGYWMRHHVREHYDTLEEAIECLKGVERDE